MCLSPGCPCLFRSHCTTSALESISWQPNGHSSYFRTSLETVVQKTWPHADVPLRSHPNVPGYEVTRCALRIRPFSSILEPTPQERHLMQCDSGYVQSNAYRQGAIKVSDDDSGENDCIAEVLGTARSMRHMGQATYLVKRHPFSNA